MNVTTEQVRSALEEMAEAGATPDPRTLLTGASREVGRLRRRRQAGWLGAAAAAVVAIGGGSLLLTELAGDTQGEVAPAEPDQSYTEGYGIVDGQVQPYLEGLRLIGTQKVTPTDERLVSVPDAAADTQLYAVAWCDPAESGLQEPPPVQLAADRFTAEMPCLDRSTDLNSAVLLQPLPPYGMDYTLEVPERLDAVLGFYVEETWQDYPFPVTEPTPFSATEGIVIDSFTPESADPTLDAVPPETPVHSVTVPITDDLMALTMQIDQPGQLLVALDGVVLTNDAEDLEELETSRSEPWHVADPSVREGYLLSFGPPVQRSLSLNAQILAEEGVDVSDGEVTVSVHARGFVDDSVWRVAIGGTIGGQAGPLAPLEPATDTDVAQYAYGHRLVAAYDVRPMLSPTRSTSTPGGLPS